MVNLRAGNGSAVTVAEASSKVGPGSYVRFRGDVLRVEEIDPTRVVAADLGRQVVRTVSLAAFLAESHPCSRAGEVLSIEQDLQWELTADAERRHATAYMLDLLWVIYDQRLESITDYETATPKRGRSRRVTELAARLSRSERQIWRDLTDLSAAHGPSGLVRPKATRRRRSAIDPRWEDKIAEIVARVTPKSTLDRGIVLELAAAELNAEFGKGVVRIPGKSTAYEYLKANYDDLNAFRGSAKGRRSIAERPKISLRQLKPTHAGEYVIMDTQTLDLYAMDAATWQWVRCQLTIAMDLYTRSIVGLVVTPISTKAIDVASVLFETCHPKPIRHRVAETARWNYHGVPENLVFTEKSHHWGMPLIAAENLIIDNGRAFLSAHVLEVSRRKGINVWPAQPYKPTDKPTVERFFGSLRRDLIMRLPGYSGPDVYSRGANPEGDAFFFVHEIEDIIRNWITRRYHKKRHAGLVHPRWPHQRQSPDRMYELSVEVHGLPRIPHSPYAFVDFLPVKWRKLHHYGFEVRQQRRYRGDILATFNGRESPYAGPHAGKWPIRYNPDDITIVYIQDPRDLKWHELEWEHAHKIDVPLSEDTYAFLRRNARRHGIPAEKTSDIIVDWLTTIEMSRRDRNALIRTLHVARAKQQDSVPADPGYLPDFTAPTEPVPSEELAEESAWDDTDDEDAAGVVADCVAAARGDTTAIAQADLTIDSSQPSDRTTPAEEPLSPAAAADGDSNLGDSDEEDDDDDYMPAELLIR